ncbi:BQ5605_C026g10206 [Microbotryum silenes-dioicae]|uniref:BQ5605_C026g10206 protein n=1 Tax=Microbotryum silenes-dioicae TaxID=796604 RepID=A0A2X0MQJ9_9BASI|nr:BQ5605_C026g10206 [Microbotryum silenes-dioicae]
MLAKLVPDILGGERLALDHLEIRIVDTLNDQGTGASVLLLQVHDHLGVGDRSIETVHGPPLSQADVGGPHMPMLEDARIALALEVRLDSNRPQLVIILAELGYLDLPRLLSNDPTNFPQQISSRQGEARFVSLYWIAFRSAPTAQQPALEIQPREAIRRSDLRQVESFEPATRGQSKQETYKQFVFNDARLRSLERPALLRQYIAARVLKEYRTRIQDFDDILARIFTVPIDIAAKHEESRLFREILSPLYQECQRPLPEDEIRTDEDPEGSDRLLRWIQKVLWYPGSRRRHFRQTGPDSGCLGIPRETFPT